MARFTSLSAIVYVVGAAVAYNLPNSLFGVLEWIGVAGLLVSACYYSYRLFVWLKGKLLWKVRNKIIISFSFVGLIPVVILAFITYVSVTFIFRQLSVVYLENEFEQVESVLKERSSRIGFRYYQSGPPRERRLVDLVRQEQESFVALTPGLSETTFSVLKRVSSRDTISYQLVASFPERLEPGSERVVPHWAREGFDGLVSDSGQLYFRSLIPLKVGSREYMVYLDLPMEGQLADYIQERTSINTRFLDPAEFDSPSKAIADLFSSGELSRIRWGHILTPEAWENDVNPNRIVHGVALEVPLSSLFQHYFTQSAGFGSLVLIIIGSLGLVFILVEIVSVLVGAAIARSITRSIYNIDEGARNIEAGNLDYRIPSRNRDQLDAMAEAFNRMSASVVDLMNQVSEKERLEKEIEIAREVQTHLFPREMPQYRQLQLAASCLAARRVSGDYYDFIPYGDERLDVIIADISGKGISAALLMASLHSSIRSHVTYQSVNSDGDAPVADAVCAINRQLYTHTSPDKFATMVFSRIDTRALTLTYCNAGHNPPLLISNGTITHLTKGGIVAGLFEKPLYDQEKIQLQAGDLVVFYTDGVVEAENPQGEQFEQARLEELLQGNAFLTADDIRSLILDEISNWVRGYEQSDDITVVTLKVEAG